MNHYHAADMFRVVEVIHESAARDQVDGTSFVGRVRQRMQQVMTRRAGN